MGGIYEGTGVGAGWATASGGLLCRDGWGVIPSVDGKISQTETRCSPVQLRSIKNGHKDGQELQK